MCVGFRKSVLCGSHTGVMCITPVKLCDQSCVGKLSSLWQLLSCQYQACRCQTASPAHRMDFTCFVFGLSALMSAPFPLRFFSPVATYPHIHPSTLMTRCSSTAPCCYDQPASFILKSKDVKWQRGVCCRALLLR